MIIFSLTLFYFYLSTMKNITCVRIFQNILPKADTNRFGRVEPQVISKTCLLKPQRGPCRAGIKMFYFNPATEECIIFDWGGCQGNGNRFKTKEDCENTCLSKPGDGRRRPTWCSLTFEYGYCFGAIERWYFDKLWQVCKKTIYSGCGGNNNNFASQEKCESVCIYAKSKNDGENSKYLTINSKRTTGNKKGQDDQRRKNHEKQNIGVQKEEDRESRSDKLAGLGQKEKDGNSGLGERNKKDKGEQRGSKI